MIGIHKWKRVSYKIGTVISTGSLGTGEKTGIIYIEQCQICLKERAFISDGTYSQDFDVDLAKITINK